MIEPGMLGHVLIPHKLEGVCIPSRMFIHFDVHIQCWTIVGGREGRETRHTVFFTPSNHEVPKKKKIVMSSRSPEKFTTNQVEVTFKMLFIGSILAHRRKA